MTTTQDSAVLPADEVAMILAASLEAALGWGLPEPGLISIESGGNGRCPRGIGLQFSGPDRAGEVSAWASRFSAPVSVAPSKEGSETWYCADFRFLGVAFHAYAVVKAGQSPQSLIP